MPSISPLGTQSSRCSGDEMTAKKAFMASSVSREINGMQLCSFLQVTVLEAAIWLVMLHDGCCSTWTTDVTTTNGMKYYQLKRAAEDRKRWHGLVASCFRPVMGLAT